MGTFMMIATIVLASGASSAPWDGDAICGALAAKGQTQAPLFFTTIWWEHGSDYASAWFRCDLVGERFELRPGQLSLGLKSETVPISIPIESFALERTETSADGVNVFFAATGRDGSAVVLDYNAMASNGRPEFPPSATGTRPAAPIGLIYLRLGAAAFRRLELLCPAQTPCSVTHGPSWTPNKGFYEFITVADSDDQGERLAFLLHDTFRDAPLQTAAQVWSREPSTRLSAAMARALRARAKAVAEARGGRDKVR